MQLFFSFYLINPIRLSKKLKIQVKYLIYIHIYTHIHTFNTPIMLYNFTRKHVLKEVKTLNFSRTQKAQRGVDALASSDVLRHVDVRVCPSSKQF